MHTYLILCISVDLLVLCAMIKNLIQNFKDKRKMSYFKKPESS